MTDLKHMNKAKQNNEYQYKMCRFHERVHYSGHYEQSLVDACKDGKNSRSVRVLCIYFPQMSLIWVMTQYAKG